MYTDISLEIKQGSLAWPSGYSVKIMDETSIKKGDRYSSCILKMDLQTATHIKAPSYYYPSDITTDGIDINSLIGPCHLERVDTISENINVSLNSVYSNILLVDSQTYEASSIGIPTIIKYEFIKQCMEHGIKLLCIDSLLTVITDQTGPGIPIVHGANIGNIAKGKYNIVVAPLLIKNVDACPARVLINM